MCNVIPNGVVVFFTSYAYQNLVHSVWEEKGIHKRIELKKKVCIPTLISNVVRFFVSNRT